MLEATSTSSCAHTCSEFVSIRAVTMASDRLRHGRYPWLDLRRRMFEQAEIIAGRVVEAVDRHLTKDDTAPGAAIPQRGRGGHVVLDCLGSRARLTARYAETAAMRTKMPGAAIRGSRPVERPAL